MPAQMHATVEWLASSQVPTLNVQQSLSELWSTLSAPVDNESRQDDSSGIKANTPTKPASVVPTADTLLNETDLNNRPQVHAALRQLSEDQQQTFLITAHSQLPNDPFINGLLGIRYLNQSQWSQADVCFSIASKENDPIIWFHLGLLQQHQGKLHEAISYYERALALRANPDHFVLLIRACLETNVLSKALEHQEVASATYPNDPRFASYRARILCAQGKLEQALQWCLDNDCMDTGSALLKQASQILVDLNRGPQAQSLYKKAMLRDIAQQPLYRQHASQVKAQLSSDQATELTTLWQEQAKALLAVQCQNAEIKAA